MSLLLAALPILIPVVLLLVFRQPAFRAGLAGMSAAILVASAPGTFQLDGAGVADALARGALTTAIVAYVLLGGFFLYQVLRTGGALATLSGVIVRALPDPAHRLLTLVYGVSVFFESATGFGIGIVVSAPLFLALGYAPLTAALLALLGQCAVPWGALAIGTVLGAELTGVPLTDLGANSVILGLPLIALCGGVALGVAGELRPLLVRLVQLAMYVAVLATALWLSSIWVAVELAGCLAGLVVLGFGLALSRGQREPYEAAREAGPGLTVALLPVGLLVAALLATRLIGACKSWLSAQLVIDITRFDFQLPVLYHPGFWMLLSALAGGLACRFRRDEWRELVRESLRGWLLATLAVAGFICGAQVMVDAGMTARLAGAAADSLGHAYLFLVPWIGAVGGFLTASNAGANAMFMQLHQAAAQALSLPLDDIAAAQNAAASNATLASPGRVVLAAAVVGCAGQEYRLLRPALAMVAAGTAATMVLLLVI